MSPIPAVPASGLAIRGPAGPEGPPGSGGGGAVSSVNTQTGDVVLDYSDVGAASVADLSAEVTARNAAITAAIDALVAGAPGALDTLGELAAALGDTTTSLAAKADQFALDTETSRAEAAETANADAITRSKRRSPAPGHVIGDPGDRRGRMVRRPSARCGTGTPMTMPAARHGGKPTSRPGIVPAPGSPCLPPTRQQWPSGPAAIAVSRPRHWPLRPPPVAPHRGRRRSEILDPEAPPEPAMSTDWRSTVHHHRSRVTLRPRLRRDRGGAMSAAGAPATVRWPTPTRPARPAR